MISDDIKLGKYLCHYGVKGMHWGEWNEETRRRYNGRTLGEKFKSERMVDRATTYDGVPDRTDWYQTHDQIRADWQRRASESARERSWGPGGGEAVQAFKLELDGRKGREEDISEAFDKVNPMHGAPGYDDNCMACAISTWFRTKGYDVEADSSLQDDYELLPREERVSLPSSWEPEYKGEKEILANVKSKTMSTTDYVGKIFGKDLQDPLGAVNEFYKNTAPDTLGNDWREVRQKYNLTNTTESYDTNNHNDSLMCLEGLLKHRSDLFPEGSSGFIRGGYTGGSGHILNYKIENGEFACYDGQTHEKQNLHDAIKDFADGSVSYLRTDDISADDIDYTKLFEWSGLRPARPRY